MLPIFRTAVSASHLIPMIKHLFSPFFALTLIANSGAAPSSPETPPPVTPTNSPVASPDPTWETQKHARTYVLGIPGPRGQIVDRDGNPLAQSRVSHNLGLSFPTPLTMTDAEVWAFAQQQVLSAKGILGRPLSLNHDQVLKHYKNRGIVEMLVAQDLSTAEIENFKRLKPAHLTLQAVYQRYYPNADLAGHILGYAGRSGRMPDGPIQNNELLWPDAVGREGLEQSFDYQLRGKNGQYTLSFDPSGKKSGEKVSIHPQPGYNVVTTLDSKLQRLCEKALEKGVKRGAMVIMDPNNGDILAMASWPTIDPNWFIPTISEKAFKSLNDDPNIPLIPRAYRSTYPPGSVFKVAVGLAALQEHIVSIDDEFSCPSSLEIGNLTFRNWKKTDSGSLNFRQAMTQSCDTWFYQVGIKTGALRMADWATKLGFGSKTGIPLAAEASGRIPTDEYMMKAHKRKMGHGDLANFSIGQGDVEVTPLQMAQAMATVGNGGTLYKARLVLQVQSIDGQVVNTYPVRARAELAIDPKIIKEMRKALSDVVSSSSGTAGKASVPNVQMAGKTGTAQWGPKTHERTCAWFAGFAPAEKPKYAFVALYESDFSTNSVHGGTVAAPIVGSVMREIFKNEAKPTKSTKKKKPDEDAPVEVRRALPVDPVEPVQEPDLD